MRRVLEDSGQHMRRADSVPQVWLGVTLSMLIVSRCAHSTAYRRPCRGRFGEQN